MEANRKTHKGIFERDSMLIVTSISLGLFAAGCGSEPLGAAKPQKAQIGSIQEGTVNEYPVLPVDAAQNDDSLQESIQESTTISEVQIQFVEDYTNAVPIETAENMDDISTTRDNERSEIIFSLSQLASQSVVLDSTGITLTFDCAPSEEETQSVCETEVIVKTYPFGLSVSFNFDPFDSLPEYNEEPNVDEPAKGRKIKDFGPPFIIRSNSAGIETRGFLAVKWTPSDGPANGHQKEGIHNEREKLRE